MSRLPTVGGDAGNWGEVLNDYLSQSHQPDGKLRADVATISALKALTVSTIPDKMQVMVGGYYAHGDGGGGQFYYDTSSSTADNGGTVIAPTVGSGRWKRIWTGVVFAKWFGARFNTAVKTAGAISAGSTTLTLSSTSNLAVGMIIFVPGAGVAGANLRGVIASITNGTTVVLDTAASTTVSGVTMYCGNDDYVAIQTALNLARSTHGVCQLPYGIALIESPIEWTVESAAITLRGVSKYNTAIICNTGNVGIDMCGSSNCKVEDLRLYAVDQLNNPMTVGIALMRSESRVTAGYCEFRRIEIYVPTNPSANGGAGTIALYNFGGEFSVHDTINYKADIPLVITNTNLYSITSPNTTVISTSTSMGMTRMIGANELSARGGGSCIVVSGAGTLNIDAYLAKVDENTEDPAINVVGLLSGGNINVNIEQYKKVLKTTGRISGVRFTGNCYTAQDVPWFDVQSTVQGCHFEMFTSGYPISVTHNYFALSGSGELVGCRAFMWTGQDSGLTETQAFGLMPVHEKFSPIRYRMVSTTALPALVSGTTTLIKYTQADHDLNSLYSTSTGHFTSPVSALYRVEARYMVKLAAASANVEFLIQVDGATQIRRIGDLPIGLSYVTVTGLVYVPKGGEMHVMVKQNSGQDSDTTGAPTFGGDNADLTIYLAQ